MKKMMGGLMLSCDKATALVEKRIDLGLTRMEQLKLIFHTSMCSGCRNYVKQSALIHELLNSRVKTFERNMHQQIVPQLKSDILKRIESLG